LYPGDAVRFLAMPRSRQRLLLEALIELARARMQLRTVPFQALVADLKSSLPVPNPVLDFATGEAVANAVHAAARRVPWRADCFPQAIAGYRMLSRRGLSVIIELGVKRDAYGALRAHAWLTSVKGVLLGGAGHQSFATVHVIAPSGAPESPAAT
jgi:hypothetical protein